MTGDRWPTIVGWTLTCLIGAAIWAACFLAHLPQPLVTTPS